MQTARTVTNFSLVVAVLLLATSYGYFLSVKDDARLVAVAPVPVAETPKTEPTDFRALLEQSAKSGVNQDMVISPDGTRALLVQKEDPPATPEKRAGVMIGFMNSKLGSITSTVTIPYHVDALVDTKFVPVAWTSDNAIVVLKEEPVICNGKCDVEPQNFWSLDISTLERVSGNHSLSLVPLSEEDVRQLKIKLP